MKKYSLIILLFGALSAAKAQQLHTTSFTEVQALIFNPSTAGLGQKLTLGATYRTQWAGTSGAPRTATVFGSVNLPDKKIGLGGYIYNDKTGATSRTGIQLAFAKHIPVSNDAQFSLGIEARAFQFSIDGAKLAENLGNDPVLNSSDNKFKFDAGFGISFTSKNFQVGASVSQLVQSKLNFYSGNQATAEEGKLYRHYYLHGMYKWNVDGATTISTNTLFPSFTVLIKNFLPSGTKISERRK